MSSAHSLLTFLSHLPNPSFVSNVNGNACLVLGHREANTTTLLPLSHAHYVLNFLVNLVSMNVITKAFFVYFFPYHCTF